VDAWAAFTATAFAFNLAVRTAYVDAGIAYDAGYDCSGLEDAHIPGAATFHELLRGAVEAIAK
jgi:hypothetical protein